MVKRKEKPRKLTFDDLMRTPLTRAMKKREYETFLQVVIGKEVDSEEYYKQYYCSLYKSAEFDHTTATESIMNTLTTVLGVVAIGSGLMIVSGGLFGFAVPGYIATAGQVAGGILTAKDIGHLITGKDINGNPLSDADKEALMGSFILDATMVGVSSLSKLKLKYANKVNKVDGIEGVSKAESVLGKIDFSKLDKSEVKDLINKSILSEEDKIIANIEIYNNAIEAGVKVDIQVIASPKFIDSSGRIKWPMRVDILLILLREKQLNMKLFLKKVIL